MERITLQWSESSRKRQVARAKHCNSNGIRRRFVDSGADSEELKSQLSSAGFELRHRRACCKIKAIQECKNFVMEIDGDRRRERERVTERKRGEEKRWRWWGSERGLSGPWRRCFAWFRGLWEFYPTLFYMCLNRSRSDWRLTDVLVCHQITIYLCSPNYRITKYFHLLFHQD